MKEIIGLVSGGLVMASIVPYAIRTFQGKIEPQLVTWALWTLIGLALLLNYVAVGATTNVWPAVFGFTNPLLVTILVFWRGKKRPPDRLEMSCIVVSLVSIGMWWFVRDNPDWATIALIVALAADFAAAVPTIRFTWTEPWGDRPFAWLAFAVGYGLAIFAIETQNVGNYILPAWMFLGPFTIAFPLVRWRIRQRVPLKEWV